jgi:hypothetical protein
MSDMPESPTPRTRAVVVDGAIPIEQGPAADEAAPAGTGPGVDESPTRRAHRLRMKAFLKAARSVA